MSRGQEKMWLLLTVKSLAFSRKPKHYQLVIENHAIDNHLNIENEFAHNYQYVYKLWPCKPAQRELIKIQMFQKVKEGKKQLIIKRGEAAPLVSYNSEGQKFQFYASKEEKCLLILKFRTENQSVIDAQAKDKPNQISKGLQKDNYSEICDSDSYVRYLDNCNPLIEQLNNDIEKEKISLLPNLQLSNNVFSVKSKKPESQSYQPTSKTAEKNQNYSSIEKPAKKGKFLDNSRYLNADIQIQEKKPASQAKTLKKRERAKTQVDIEGEDSGLSLGIKKRRQFYLHNKVETLLQKRSSSPILSTFNQPLEQSNNHEPFQNISPKEKEQQKQTLISVEVQKEKNSNRKKIEQSIQTEPIIFPERQNKQQFSEPLNKSLSKKKVQNVRASPPKDQIIRTANYPSENSNSLELSRRFGTIRRKKVSSENRYNDQEEDNTVPRPFREDCITHVSTHSRMGKTKEKCFDLDIFDFKASVYKARGRCSRRLVLVFEASRYITKQVQCSNLTASWDQTFGIRNCRQTSYLYCRLYYCSGSEQNQEGEAIISIQDLTLSDKKTFRAFFYSDELKIGYLDFGISKNQCKSNRTNSEIDVKLKGSKQNSLPQIKKESLPRGLDYTNIETPINIANSYSIKEEKGLWKQTSKVGLKRLQPKQKKEVGLVEKTGSKVIKPEAVGIGKIREKKMKMRAKLK